MNVGLIKQAFIEDIPDADITTQALSVKDKQGIAKLVAKEDMILSGRQVFQDCILYRDPESKVSWQFDDGDEVLEQQIVAQIEGNLIEIIQAERVALNFLGYLSGIARQTNQFVKSCDGTDCIILDTRKTLPLYRDLAKTAVRHGGGHNHRMSLSDAIMIKENHINIAGSLEKAVEKVRNSSELDIEVECKNIDEVKRAIDLKVSRIMLDNMSDSQMGECLKIIPKNIETEASGNMNLERIGKVAKLGVQFISVGALTHSVKNADFSILFDWSY